MSATNSINISENHNKNIELSKDAIKFLDRQYVLDLERKIVEEKFVFQIVYVIKKVSNWYNCCLMDRNQKYEGFCIKYEDQSLIPKKGDVIETKNIQIAKLINRNNYLYFCDNVKKIKGNLDLKELNLNKLNIYNENNVNFEYNQSSSNDSRNISSNKNNSNNNSFLENKVCNKEYTLVKDLLNKEDWDDIVFYVKCRGKSNIKDYPTKSEKADGKLQYYIFTDTEGETMKMITFNLVNINYFNKIINPGCVYEISKVTIQRAKEEYSEFSPFSFIISRNITKIRKLEDKGDFTKIKVYSDKINTKICDLNSKKLHVGLKIIGIVLKDIGIIDPPNFENKYRLLIVGDNTLHRIHLKLWTNIINEERVFSVGDIIYMADFYYNEYPMYCELSNSKISEVYQCQPSPIEQELRNFYKAHPNIYEYKDMTFIYLNTKKDIEFKFISDFRKINQKENDNILKTKSLKLSGTITNFIHRANNVVVSCSFCGKRVDDSHFLNCCGIPKLSFKLIIDIKDCSGHMLLDLYGKNAENFLEMTPGEYIDIINSNNEEKLKEIDRRILYKNYIFYGKCIPSTKGVFNIFSVFKFGEVNGSLYKNLIKNLASNFD